MLTINYDAKLCKHEHFDLLIVGAGPVGQIFACLLKTRERTSKLRIGLIDQRAQGSPAQAGRILALSEGSKQIISSFCPLNYTNNIISINVSSLNQFGEALLHASDASLSSLGFIIDYRELSASLDRHIATFSQLARLRKNKSSKNFLMPNENPEIIFFDTTKVIKIIEEKDKVEVFCQTADKNLFLLTANLVVCAEGQTDNHIIYSLTKQLYSHHKKITNKDRDSILTEKNYKQTAITASILISDPKKDMAFEHFTQDGAIALLPISNIGIANLSHRHELNRDDKDQFYTSFTKEELLANYSLVWSGPDHVNRYRLSLNDKEFIKELHLHFGFRLGSITHVSKRSSFALKMNINENRIGQHIIAIGNAAQTIHPIAGQGLNLGIRDALVLCNHLNEFGIDSTTLNKYAQARKKDRLYTATFTDFLAQGFQYQNCSVAQIAGKLIFLLNLLPKAKSFFIRQLIFGARD